MNLKKFPNNKKYQKAKLVIKMLSKFKIYCKYLNKGCP